MREQLEVLLSGQRLSREDTAMIYSKMFAGELNPEQIAVVLAGWRVIGESELELSLGAAAMRAAATKVEIPATARPLADNCGTGGDGSDSFNISTASAIVAAAAGVKVAKHGNRSVSSKCGSADLLFAAGLPDTLSPAQTGQLLEQTGFTFFFAPHFHPVMKHVMPVRKALGVRTVFNLLGPLANPIAPEVQLVGVGRADYTKSMAEALAKLGTKRALVVHSDDGLDEISPAAATNGFEVNDGEVSSWQCDPADLGFKADLAGLAGGDAAVNTKILHELLAGKDGAVQAAVCLNAGALIWLAGKSSSHAGGCKLAKDALSSNQAQSFFSSWISAAQKLAGA